MKFDILVNKVLKENVASDVGHILLDVAGLIPGIGEFADITNAIWYCKQKQYLYACLSLISCIPALGDVLGKGTKIALEVEKAGAQVLKAKQLIKASRPVVDKILDKASKNEKLSPYVEQMKEALIAFTGK